MFGLTEAVIMSCSPRSAQSGSLDWAAAAMKPLYGLTAPFRSRDSVEPRGFRWKATVSHPPQPFRSLPELAGAGTHEDP